MDDDLKAILQHLKDIRENPPEVAASWLAKRELAAELRIWANELCASGADEEELRELTRGLAELRPKLEVGLPSASQGGHTAIGDVAPGMETFLDRGPIAGLSNPVAPPVQFEYDIDGMRIVGEATFGKAFEGGPGIVHGGVVAAALDEALGMVCIFAGSPMMTAELTTRYHHHTPVDVPLRIEARIDSGDGRKVWSSGEITRDGERIVSATGLFIRVGTQKFADLFAAKGSGGEGTG